MAEAVNSEIVIQTNSILLSMMPDMAHSELLEIQVA
jgi:hypothetical protein